MNNNFEENCDECIEINNISKDNMLSDKDIFNLAKLFKIFGDSTRIKILLILEKSEMCVCNIANLLDMTQSAVSHQLKVLKKARLVKNRRDGKTIYYSLDDSHIKKILDQGLIHINE